ncbi:MAG: radical SAM protein, partial [Acidimicrobiales bacterium]
ASGSDPGPAVQLGRVQARVPDRSLLPDLDRYTRLAVDGEERIVGSVAASRGCSHRCRHCPVPVVYDGRVRRVDEDAVLADVDQLVAAGAQHLSFADPDFLNAPHHARRVVDAVHSHHPHLTFDATVKVEHLLRHRGLLPALAEAGCLFVVSAFESVDDAVLRLLAKGHTAADMSEAVRLLRAHGIEIRPSWLPFTPWTTGEALVALVDFVIAHDLVANVDPVQYAVRLLLPRGSLLLSEPAMVPHLGRFDPERLGWTWAHPDPDIDHLQADVAALVESRVGDDPERTFEQIEALVRSAVPGAAGGAGMAGRPRHGVVSTGPPGRRPHLTEPWFCCAEPTDAQLAPLAPLS